jgi:hypothetical protein
MTGLDRICLSENNVKKKSSKITWLILAGRKNNTESIPVKWVENTRQAMVEDLIVKLQNIDFIDRIIVSSNDSDFLEKITPADARIIPDYFFSDEKFDFAQWLNKRITRFAPENLFYWGGGASPLITGEILESLCSSIISGENILYTNNFFSADWTAFTPASAALEVPDVRMDNNLAYSLWKERNLRSIYIEPSIEIVGDVDTPADLLILAEHPGTGAHTKRYLNSLNLDTSKIRKFVDLLQDRNRIFLSGRVGSSLFKYLDTRCRCSFRIVSEERGMRSTGRLQRGEVCSILGTMFEEMGLEKTFEFIEKTSHAAVIDSRIPFAQLRGEVSTHDRFCSDLGMWEKIKDPWVRDFTRRASESKIPFLLGGHSLILGGMWSLVSAYGEIPIFM